MKKFGIAIIGTGDISYKDDAFYKKESFLEEVPHFNEK